MIQDYAYSLMAGRVYLSTKDKINWLPVPDGWDEVTEYRRTLENGFEATFFQRGNEIVIAYAGTAELVDWDDNGALALGVGSSQLDEAAAYYMEIRQAYPDAEITLTGHSLGGGLASLVGVFFDEPAVTFDQAPFRASANNDVRDRLLSHLSEQGFSSGPAIDALQAFHSDMPANGVGESSLPGIRGEENIRGLYVQGEVLEQYLPFGAIGQQNPVIHGADGLSSIELHSQTLLTAFLLSDEFRQATINLHSESVSQPDLSRMLFDDNLYARKTSSGEQNFLERMIRYQVGMPEENIDTNGMLDRFSRDMNLLAKSGVLTMTDGNTTNDELHELNQTLIAFAMQMYYKNPEALQPDKVLFNDLTDSGGANGISFDINDVAPTLNETIGYQRYFKDYLMQSTYSDQERALIEAKLPELRDWYVQSGTSGMIAMDDQGRGAFMLGGSSCDVLTGGNGDDLLISGKVIKNAFDAYSDDFRPDILAGGEGNDTYLVGHGDQINDTDGVNSVLYEGKSITGNYTRIGESNFYRHDDGSRLYIDDSGTAHLSGGQISIQNFQPENYGITLSESEPLLTEETLNGNESANYLTPQYVNSPITYSIAGGTGSDYIMGNTGSDVLNGGNDNDWIVGNGGADHVNGGGGADYITGLHGGSVALGGEGNDIISAIHYDAIIKGVTDTSIRDWISDDIFWQDTAAAFFHPDTVFSGSDLLITSGFKYTYDETGALAPITGESAANGGWSYKMTLTYDNVWTCTYYHDDYAPDGKPISWSYGHYTGNYNDSQSVTLMGEAGDDVLIGNAGDDNLAGGVDSDIIMGNGGDDLMSGDAGHDVLFGGNGNDFILGGSGNDYLQGDTGNDTLIGDTENDTLIGGSGSDMLYGGDGNDVLSGGSGIDYLIGGKGHDTYLFQLGDGSDHIDDNNSDGSGNTLELGVGFNPYNIKLKLGSLAIQISDTDVIHLDNFDPENPDAGASGITQFKFADGTVLSYQELLSLGFDTVGTDADDVLMGTSLPDNLYGLDGDDEIHGLAHNDYIDGGTGADTMYGGAGDDTYVVDNVGDVVIEEVDEGNDTIIASSSWTLGDNIENLTLDGNEAIQGVGNALDNVIQGNQADNVLEGLDGDDTLFGGDGSDYLDGGAGADTMFGGTGADTYIVDNSNDVVVEDNQDDSIDVVRSSVSYQLPSSAVEQLELTGDADIDGTGNALDNTITGNMGNNRLDGSGGADTLIGGEGDDTYVVDQLDTVVEAADQGIDTVEAGFDYTLGNNIENLTLTGSAKNATGNELDNTLRGNASANTLDGLAGADAMYGGAGNDVYYVDNSNDSVIEEFGEGMDTVYSSANFTLGSNVEYLKLIGDDAIDGTGNELANRIDGNDAANTLSGDGGDDVLYGHGGNDTIYGDAGDDRIDGGTGADTMIGGAGNDIFYVDDGGDITVENTNEGHDTVYSSVTHTLGENVDDLYLNEVLFDPLAFLFGNGDGGNPNFDGTGNDIANSIYGNSGDNTLSGLGGNDTLQGGLGQDILDGGDGDDVLDGGTGNDTLIGGAGNDTYYVDTIYDTIIEAQDEGFDSVISTDSYALSDNIEELRLNNEYYAWGTGNEQENFIYGYTGENTLEGMGGDDYLDGHAGDDALYGGDGNDWLYGGEDAYVEEAYGGYYFDGEEFIRTGGIYLASNNDYLDGGDIGVFIIPDTACAVRVGN